MLHLFMNMVAIANPDALDMSVEIVAWLSTYFSIINDQIDCDQSPAVCVDYLREIRECKRQEFCRKK